MSRPPASFADHEARREAASNFASDVVVVAGAGSGKTSLLVERLLVALLERGEELSRLAAITFTKKAAAELRDRLVLELKRVIALARGAEPAEERHAAGRLWLRRPESGARRQAAARAADAVERLEEAAISTLHSFCAALLRRHPLAAGVAPGFAVDEGQAFARLCEEQLPAVISASLAAVSPAARGMLAEIPVQVLAGAAREAARQEEAPVPEAIADPLDALVSFAAAAGRRLREAHLAAGWLGFDETVRRARRLLEEDAAVREREQRRWTEILVDELQDTDPNQYRILQALAAPAAGAGRPRLFLVGDPKQSIYRFRRADLAAYTRFTGEVQARGLRLSLTSNYRSLPGLLAPVNRLFEQVMAGEAEIQPRYEAIAAARAEGRTDGPAAEASPGPELRLVELPAAATADSRREIEAAAVVAELLRHRQELGWKWGEMLVLLPKFTGLPQLMHALHQAGVPFAADGGRSFFRRQEVADFAALLTAWLGPGLAPEAFPAALLALLRSSVGGVADAELWAYRRALAPDARFGERAGRSAAAPLVHRLLERLEEWRRAFAGSPEDQVPELLLRASGLRATWGLRRNGAQAVANLDKAAEAVAATVRDLDLPLAAAARLLDDRLGEDEEADQSVSEEGGEAVSVLTVHKAKGLERRLVIVAGFDGGELEAEKGFKLVADETRGYALRLDQEQRNALYDQWAAEHRRHLEAEKLRLLYVALTRARDRLVLIQGASRPSGKKRNLWLEALEQGWGYVPGQAFPSCPGVAFERWAPEQLASEAAAPRRPKEEIEGSVQAVRRFAQQVPRAVARYATPSALGVSENDAGRGAAGASAGAAEGLGRAAGIVLHRLFEAWDYRDFATLGAGLEGRAQAAAAEAEVSAAAVVERVKAILERLPGTACGRLLRSLRDRERYAELPLLHHEDGRTWSGVLDLLYRDASGAWVVADFKTDRGLSAAQARARYGAQLSLYGRAVQSALRLPAPPRLELLLLDGGEVVVLEAP